MWARFNQWEVPLDSIESAVDEVRTYLVDKAVPEVRQQPGYKGAYSFVNWENGQGITISLWDSEVHLRASEANAARQRKEGAERVGGTDSGMDRFEVIHVDDFDLP